MKLYGSLDNYISSHRRSIGLSQQELATLLAIESRAIITYYEQGLHLPKLGTALALEVVLGCPSQELFAGVAERVRESVSKRAEALLLSIGDTPTKENARKLETLAKLAYPDEPHLVPLWENLA